MSDLFASFFSDGDYRLRRGDVVSRTLIKSVDGGAKLRLAGSRRRPKSSNLLGESRRREIRQLTVRALVIVMLAELHQLLAGAVQRGKLNPDHVLFRALRHDALFRRLKLLP